MARTRACYRHSAVSDWRSLEIHADLVRLTGEFEIVRPDRLIDAVNRFGDYLRLRRGRVQPLSVAESGLTRTEAWMTVAKAAVTLICPLDDVGEGNPAMWREKIAQPAVVTTRSFSMIGDVHLEPRHGLQDHLERFPGDFLPMTNLSALWIGTVPSAMHTLHRGFALLNPTAILTFASR